MKYSIFIIIIFTCWSCTTLKPNSAVVSPFDIDKRTEIQNPTYYSGLNVLGAGSIIAGTLGGAYAGYRSKAIQYNSGVEQKTLDVGNIIIGAVVGYTFSYYGNRLLGWGKTQKAPDYTKWLYKVNSNYTLLNNRQPNVIRAIHSSAESNFTVNKLSDAHDFAQAFKNSSYTDKLIDQTLNNKTLLRSDFADMARTFTKANNAVKLKKEYILRSNNVTELFEGIAKYPKIISEQQIQLKSSDLIANMVDLKKYKARFTGLEYDDKIFSNIYENLSIQDLTYLIKEYPKSTDIHDAKVLLISKTASISNLKLLLTEYGNKYQKYIEDKAENLVLDDRTKFADFINVFPNARRLIHKENNYFLGSSNAKRQPEGMGMGWNKATVTYLIGNFNAGKLSGTTCEIDDPSYNYKGGMVNGEKSGEGKEINTEDGYTYEGGFSGDEFSGNGVYTGKLGIITRFAGTGTFIGNFYNGVAHGKGKTTLNLSNCTFEGEFKNGLMNGKGIVYFNKTGVTATGSFNDNEPNGVFQLSVRRQVTMGKGLLDFFDQKIFTEEISSELHSIAELNKAELTLLETINYQISAEKSERSSSSSSSSSSNSDDRKFEDFKKDATEKTKFIKRDNPPSAFVTSKDCPCEFHEIDFTWPKDNVEIYQDSKSKWWIQKLILSGPDLGPFITFDDLLRYLYKLDK